MVGRFIWKFVPGLDFMDKNQIYLQVYIVNK